MSLTSTEDLVFIQGQIDLIAQDEASHSELSWALPLLTRESQERVAGILRRKLGTSALIDLEELLLESV